MDSPADYLDSPMDGDDVAYPCKGCGDVGFSDQMKWDGRLTVNRRYWRRGRLSNLVSESSLLATSARARLVAFLISINVIDIITSHLWTPPGSKFNSANGATAGNRWHLNCFRCNTCGTLLDSDANLLLLGDGSLICNN